MNEEKIHALLDQKCRQYNKRSFIPNDPIAIPHQFTELADIEIAGFFAAVFAWGNRTTILNKSRELLQLMDNAPHEFIIGHRDTDLKTFLSFVHRTYNATDLLYFIDVLQRHYKEHASIEDAFVPCDKYKEPTVEQALVRFHEYFFEGEHPDRTRKHVATPARNSACKRLNMYLRWMVRKDKCGVDFGIWKKISPAQLVCPLDVHVARVAARLGMIPNDKADWKNALLLTEQLRTMDAADPAKYDFALFGLGAEERL
jgi:uncharacterized protein (TIGR02757 family)